MGGEQYTSSTALNLCVHVYNVCRIYKSIRYALLFVQFCEDIWLMFDNCWTYNKKGTRVYKMGLKLSEVFDVHIDDAMKKLGYCCGRRVSSV